jgi:hypothetical protein
MVQPSEGDILVPIRAVPSERLINPLGRGTDGVAPAVVVPRFGEGAVAVAYSTRLTSEHPANHPTYLYANH